MILALFSFLLYGSAQDVSSDEYRSISGSSVNLASPSWGSAATGLRSTTEKTSSSQLPSSRLVSNVLQLEQRPFTELSHFQAAWAMVVQADLLEVEFGSEIGKIAVPLCDPWLDAMCEGNASIPYFRHKRKEGDPSGQPINRQTTWLDASFLYGNSAAENTALREQSTDGSLLCEMRVHADGLLPPYDSPGIAMATLTGARFTSGMPGKRMAGFQTANFHPWTLLLPAILLHEHNHWCAILRKRFAPSGRMRYEEMLFEESRRRVIAEVQHVTVNEFIPSLIGHTLAPYAGYDPGSNPTAETQVAAALNFWIGLLPEIIPRYDPDGSEAQEGHLLLRDVIDRPHIYLSAGAAPLLRAMGQTGLRKTSANVPDGLRQFLGSNATSKAGSDLLALVVRRMRDFGLPAYNVARESRGLSKATTFSEITPDADAASALSTLYSERIHDVELLTGGLFESPVAGGTVGPLFASILEEHFLHIRDCDRFWYENQQFPAEDMHVIQSKFSEILDRSQFGATGSFFISSRSKQNPSITQEYLFDSQYNMSWYCEDIQGVGRSVRITLSVQSTGWVGVAVAPEGSSGMDLADVVICSFSSGTARCTDCYATLPSGEPLADIVQGGRSDVFDVQGSEVNGVTTVSFWRPLDSGDEFDYPLPLGKAVKVLFAYSPWTDTFSYHGSHRGYRSLTLDAPQSKSRRAKPWLLMGLGIGGVVLLVAVGTVAVLITFRKRQLRLAGAAPLGRVVIGFTDIEGSTELWDAFPELMERELQVHNVVMRTVLRRHSAYEVKTQGDSFMFCGSGADAARAILCAVEMQSELLKAPWSPQLLELPNCAEVQKCGKVVWRGLRVRIGMHLGTPQVSIQRGQVDYLGPVVNLAARVEAVACGGQICVTEELWHSARGALQDKGITADDLGCVPLKGIVEPQRIYGIQAPDFRNLRLFSLPTFTTMLMASGSAVRTSAHILTARHHLSEDGISSERRRSSSTFSDRANSFIPTIIPSSSRRKSRPHPVGQQDLPGALDEFVDASNLPS